MWQDKKFLVIIGLVVVLIAAVGTIGGIYLARQDSAPQAIEQVTDGPHRITIVGFNDKNPTTWQEFIDNHLQHLIDNGTITQDEANQFNTWWESRPDIPGLFNHFMQGNMYFFDVMH